MQICLISSKQKLSWFEFNRVRAVMKHVCLGLHLVWMKIINQHTIRLFEEKQQ
jgi:hypothetical protein